MHNLFANPAMATATAVVLILESASLLFMFVLIQFYRRTLKSHREFLESFVAEGVMHPMHIRFGKSIMLWVYILFTFGITLVTLGIFLFQPHIF